MTPSNPSFVALSSDRLYAEIDPLGAQLCVLRDGMQNDLLWNGDPTIWAGRAPNLFPIVGALANGRYRLGEETYAMAKHGFARNMQFDVVDASASRAKFRLRATGETLRIYPFQFELDLDYAIHNTALTVTALIRNLGAVDMPASFGFHPAFRWPLYPDQERLSHRLTFSCDEPAPVRRINADGLLKPETFETPVVGRQLQLRDAVFTDDALIFDTMRSRSVIYGAERGPRIQVDFPLLPFVGVWTKPYANFICIEPWHGVADRQGFDGDFREKDGMLIVRPDNALPLSMTITWLAE